MAVWAVLHRSYKPLFRTQASCLLVCAGIVVLGYAGIEGGASAAAMSCKVVIFVLVWAFAYQKPRSAAKLVVLTVVTYLAESALDGHVLDKYSSVPVLLLCAILFAGGWRPRLHKLYWWIAILIEAVQSIYMESRSGLLIATVVGVLTLVPFLRNRRVVLVFAIAVPICYPLFLQYVYFLLNAGVPGLDPTASNVQRSVMAAWSVQHYLDYFLSGPGSGVFAALVGQPIEDLANVKADTADPHQFLLSTWVFLGAGSTSLLYLGWSMSWARFARVFLPSESYEATYAASLCLFAVLVFSIAPPDAYQRLLTSLICGLVLAQAAQTAPGATKGLYTRKMRAA